MTKWESKLETTIELVDPTQLQANYRNARRHPGPQRDAIRASPDTVGFVAPVIVNRTTQNVLDGHARIEEAITANTQVPVAYVEIPADKEPYILATLDATGVMADYDQQQLTDLLLDIGTTGDEGLDGMLAGIADLDLDALDNLQLEETDFHDGGTSPSPFEKDADVSIPLVERFGVPPFTTLDSRQGYWQDRKRAWKGLGLDSGDGREESLTFRKGDDYLGQKLSEQGTTSIYDPVLCEIVYRWFTPYKGAKILDPFAGGVVRGAVASKLNYEYTGIDLRPEQVEANRNQSHLWDGPGEPSPIWHVGDSQGIDGIVEGEYDLLHSCPPYADLEKYSELDGDLSNMDPEKFLELHAEVIYKSCSLLADNRFAVWTVGEVRHSKIKGGPYLGFVPSTIEAFRKAGLYFYNELVLINANGTASLRAGKQMQSGRKPAKTHQNVLVFYKGDPSKIKNHFPILEPDDNSLGGEILDLEGFPE